MADSSHAPRQAPLFKRYAYWALRRFLTHGELTLTDGRGDTHHFRGRKSGPSAELTVHDCSLWRDLVLGGHIAFCQGFVSQKWSSQDITAFFGLCTANPRLCQLLFPQSGFLRRVPKQTHRFHLMPDDHSVTFFSQWLDKSLCFSCARFDGKNVSLDEAQERKYKTLCDRLILEPHHKLLEIGPGFGGFAIYAARNHNVRVTMLSDNMRQKTYLEHKVAQEGLANLIDVQMLHMKDVPQKYDRIVTVEHIERAGTQSWGSFFEAANRCLMPGGRIEIQAIVRGPAYKKHGKQGHEFIRVNSERPTRLADPASLHRTIVDAGLLDLGHVHFGEDYLETMACWHKNFIDNWPQIQLLGYDATFRRLWTISLHYCAAAFKKGHLDVIQKSVTKPFDAA